MVKKACNNNSSTPHTRILCSTELPQIDTEEEKDDASDDENNEVFEKSDKELEDDSDKEDNTGEDSNIVEDWDIVFCELDRIDEEEYVELLYIIDMLHIK